MTALSVCVIGSECGISITSSSTFFFSFIISHQVSLSKGKQWPETVRSASE